MIARPSKKVIRFKVNNLQWMLGYGNNLEKYGNTYNSFSASMISLWFNRYKHKANLFSVLKYDRSISMMSQTILIPTATPLLKNVQLLRKSKKIVTVFHLMKETMCLLLVNQLIARANLVRLVFARKSSKMRSRKNLSHAIESKALTNMIFVRNSFLRRHQNPLKHKGTLPRKLCWRTWKESILKILTSIWVERGIKISEICHIHLQIVSAQTLE